MIRFQITPSAGRGVFATEPIATGATIEQAPVIVIPAAEAALISQTILDSYSFWWDEAAGSVAIALGMGSLYNHSATPNAEFRMVLADRLIEFVALRAIEAGEEVTIRYDDAAHDPSSIVFEGETWRLATPGPTG